MSFHESLSPPLGLDSKHLHTLQSRYLLPVLSRQGRVCAPCPSAGKVIPRTPSPAPLLVPCPRSSASWDGRKWAASSDPGGAGALGRWGGREVGFTALFTWLVSPLTLNAFVGL